ncbi:MAG: HDOD domain-containing protein [Gammaproteobacteria bacterium]
MAGDTTGHTDLINRTAHRILNDEIEELPMVPDIAVKLLTLTRDDNASFDDLSRLIETEPTLSAKILQNVNSAAFALPNPVSSIRRAVNLLGFSAVRRIALALIIFSQFIKQKTTRIFDPLFFWQHCLFVATLSRRVALALGHPDPDRVYTAGLLHDIGKIVLESYGKKTYSEYIASLNNCRHSTPEEERRFFGATHSEIGHVLCLKWKLPASVTAVVAYHHDQPAEEQSDEAFGSDIAMVSFADYIAWMHGIASFSAESRPLISRQAFDRIDISQLKLESLLREVDKEMLNIREFFGIQFPDLGTLRATLVQTSIALSQSANMQTETMSPKSDRGIPSSLTAPHQSLDPDHFVPMTLEAIQSDFGLDRIIMFKIDPVRRSLVSAYRRPESTDPESSRPIEISIDSTSGLLLDCFREKKPILIHAGNDPDNPVLRQLNIEEFILIPILHHNRLAGAIVADHSVTRKKMSGLLPAEITPIARQLGVALYNAKQYDDEKKRAERDSLTQLLNKRAIDQALTEIFRQDRKKLENMAVGFVDIDKFKLFNDTCGHQAGDEIIRIVAEILARSTRPGDLIGRYGGEEFLFILNNAKPSGALSYAERIRAEIERHGKTICAGYGGLPLTVSIGISIYHPNCSDFSCMIEIADQAMYRAKNEGRNRVILLCDDSGPV